MAETKVYTKAEIADKLATNDRWLIHGLMAIYAKQTYEEQAGDRTVEENGMGFNAFDAPILSDMARQYQTSGYLSKRQLVIIRKCMKKYAGQLVKIANGQG